MVNRIIDPNFPAKLVSLVDSSGSILDFVTSETTGGIAIPVDTEITVVAGTITADVFSDVGGNLNPALIDSSRRIIISPSSTISVSPSGTQDVNIVGSTSTLDVNVVSGSITLVPDFTYTDGQVPSPYEGIQIGGSDPAAPTTFRFLDVKSDGLFPWAYIEGTGPATTVGILTGFLEVDSGGDFIAVTGNSWDSTPTPSDVRGSDVRAMNFMHANTTATTVGGLTSISGAATGLQDAFVDTKVLSVGIIADDSGELALLDCRGGKLITTGNEISSGVEHQDISVTSVSSSVTHSGAVVNITGVLIQNIGSTDCFVTFGTGATSATTSSASLPAGATIELGATGFGTIAAITASGTTTVRVTWLGS